MKALFCTTLTNEVAGHVSAWGDFTDTPYERVTFDHRGIRNDHLLTEAAERVRPDIIFYIGACNAPGNPRPETFVALRKLAPSVNLCSDAKDRPWHPVLAGMRTRGCFDLQVSIDGAKIPEVDHATLTPVDTRYFENGDWPARDIRCGFSGSVGRWNARSEIVNALEWFGGLTVRRRENADGYEEHVRFLKRCAMVLNLSWTGSQQAHHIKGRVLEAGWAGACLLEHRDSPIGEWFPKDCYLTFDDAKDAASLIKNAPADVIRATANRLAAYVREHYTPAKIYGEIVAKTLKARQTVVAAALAKPAA